MVPNLLDRRIEQLLLGAEQQVRLLDRVNPLNLSLERERLLAVLLRGESAEPQFLYGAPPDLRRTRTMLEKLARHLETEGVLGGFYAGRAEELEREAALAEAIGGVQFRRLAGQYVGDSHPGPPDALGALIEEWLHSRMDESDGERVMSDDLAHPRSLLNILRRRIGSHRSAIRIEVRPGLATLAAAGQDLVRIRPSVLLEPARAERIAVHELLAHVFPRHEARFQPTAIFRTGTRGSFKDEEGRAVLLEERVGLLDGGRRRELALRHLAAELVLNQAEFGCAVRTLRHAGAEPGLALDAILRAQRGGGLARERIYLPAYLRVRSAFMRKPALERAFERGRVSVEAAEGILDLVLAPGSPSGSDRCGSDLGRPSLDPSAVVRSL